MGSAQKKVALEGSMNTAFAYFEKPYTVIRRRRKMNKDDEYPVSNRTNRPTTLGGMSIRDWWPNQLNLKILHQNSPMINPMDAEFKYAEEFKKLDFKP